VAVGTCGCCCGADGAAKATANHINRTPSPIMIARVSLALPASVWISRYARAPALTSGPTAPASLSPGIGIPGKTKDADTILGKLKRKNTSATVN